MTEIVAQDEATGMWPRKETMNSVRLRFTLCHKYLTKAVALVKTLKPEQIDLSIWANKDQTVMCPACWCGVTPEFQEAGLVFQVPDSYQSNPEPVPTFSFHKQDRRMQQTGAAAIVEFFELYNITNGSVNYFELFGYAGESEYDLLIGDVPDQQRFIERVGLYIQQILFDFNETFGEPLFPQE